MTHLRRILVAAILAFSLSASTATAATAPGAPINLAAVGSNASVQLTWNAPASDGGSTITAYNVYRGTTSGGETLLTTLGSVTSYTDSTASNGTTYYYEVTAVNSIGESVKSSEVSVKPGLPNRPSEPKSVSSTHFVVHYSDAPGTPGHVTQQKAQDIAALAELAYSTIVTSWGFAAPPADGTGAPSPDQDKIDIYVTDLSQWQYAYGVVADGSHYSIDIDPTLGADTHGVTGSVFSLVADYIWNFNDAWITEAAGEWAAMSIQNFPSVNASQLGPWDMSLDCDQLTSSTPNSGNCQSSFYTGSGQSRWPFLEFLNERFGSSFLKTLFTNGASASQGDEIQELTDTIAAAGDTFDNTFNAWASANMSGGYNVQSLKTILPTATNVVPTGTLATLQQGLPAGSPLVTSGPIPKTTVTVGHLATKYLALQRGDGTTTDACYAATLDLSVTLPSGATGRPAFWWSALGTDGSKQAVQTLSVSGDTASISVPWDTCNWGTTYGYLSLPNPSSSDGQSFIVNGRITVDPLTPASTQLPPPVTLPTSLLPVPGADPTPTIDVFGPSVVHLPASASQLQIVAAAANSGLLRATVGSVDLGTAALRAGNNDCRYTLTAAARNALRLAGGNGLPLTLTPLSSTGVAGAVTVLHVVLDPAATTARRAAKRRVAR